MGEKIAPGDLAAVLGGHPRSGRCKGLRSSRATANGFDRAANVGIPILCEWREMAERGCTFAYGPDVQSIYRTVGRYVARLFEGEKPSDLPIEQPSKLDFTINLRAAKALGLTIPPTLLARADEVIE